MFHFNRQGGIQLALTLPNRAGPRRHERPAQREIERRDL